MYTPIMLMFFALFFLGSLALMCIFREKLASPLINNLFVISTVVFYFFWNLAGSWLGWLDDGFLTLENISPFICTVIIIAPLMHGKIRDYAYASIAFLSFGMFLALFLSPLENYLLSYRKEATLVYASEAACHLIMGLYGFYLFLSGRVKVDLAHLRRGIIFTYSAVLVGVFCNLFFKMNNFGMNMYGDYSIYSLRLFKTFEATFAAYLIGYKSSKQ